MAEDYFKTAQDIILKGAQDMIEDPSLGASDKLLGDLVGMLEGAAENDAALPAGLLEQIDMMKTMQASIAEVEALFEAGDHEAALELSKQIGGSVGAPGSDDYEPYPDIFDAVEDGDIEAVTAGLADWDINQGFGEYECTLLYRAMSPCGVDPSFAMMHALLDAGADPCIGLGTTSGVLHGIGFGYYKDDQVDDLLAVIQRCVALGADLEERSDHLDWTPLHTALNEWNTAATKALLLAGADPNAACSPDAPGCTGGQTALEMVLGEAALFEMLLDHGADTTKPCRDGTDVRSVLQSYLATAEPGEWADGLATCLAILERRKLQ